MAAWKEPGSTARLLTNPILKRRNLIEADTIAKAWHNACLECWYRGTRAHTPKHRDDTPLGFDAGIVISISHPLDDPRIHRYGLCDDLVGMERYRLEVCFGTGNHYAIPVIHPPIIESLVAGIDGCPTNIIRNEVVNAIGRIATQKDVDETVARWDYTYHGLVTRPVQVIYQGKLYTVPQDELMINKMLVDWREKGRFGRDFQLTTWQIREHNLVDDPPCLQRIQFRLLRNHDEEKARADENVPENGIWSLVWIVDFRSHDLWSGWPENVYAFTDWQRLWAKRLTKRFQAEGIDIEMIPGNYIGWSSSLHLYGSYFEDTNLRGRLEQMETLDHPLRIENNNDENPDTTYYGMKTEDMFTQDDLRGYRRFIAAQYDYERITGQDDPKNRVIKASIKDLTKAGYDLDNYPYPSEWDE